MLRVQAISPHCACQGQGLLDSASHIGPPLAYLGDGLGEFIGQAGLAQQAHDPKLQDRVEQAGIVEHGHHHQGQVGVMPAQVLDQAQAVGLGFGGHHEIGDQYIAGAALQQGREGLGRVGLTDDAHLLIALQHCPQTDQENRMIVGDDNTQGLFRRVSHGGLRQ